jgi:hypothetical protein
MRCAPPAGGPAHGRRPSRAYEDRMAVMACERCCDTGVNSRYTSTCISHRPARMRKLA